MAKNNRLRKVALGQRSAATGKPTDSENIVLKSYERKILGLPRDGETDRDEVPHINLKYYAHGRECFSQWQQDELAGFSNMIRKMSLMSWVQIMASGGQLGSKTGLGYTVHRDRSKLPEHSALSTISEDITFFELRVTGEARVHGFRVRDAFFLVWLDRGHSIYPS